MAKYPFSYSVVIFVDYDQETEESRYIFESGMSLADSFADAAHILEEYYGTDLICIKSLELYEESPVILMPRINIEEYATAELGAYSIPCDERGNFLTENIRGERCD